MDIQDLVTIKDTLDYLWRTNPRRSFSGTFKYIRKIKKIDLFSDYLILAFILSYGFHRHPKQQWSRSQVLRAIRVSKFYLDEDRKNAYIPKEWEKYLT